jgi:hypothetical protein
MRYEMVDDEFRKPEAFSGSGSVALGNRYRVSDVFYLQIDPDLVINIGVVPGWKVIGEFFILKKFLRNARIGKTSQSPIEEIDTFEQLFISRYLSLRMEILIKKESLVITDWFICHFPKTKIW